MLYLRSPKVGCKSNLTLDDLCLVLTPNTGLTFCTLQAYSFVCNLHGEEAAFIEEEKEDPVRIAVDEIKQEMKVAKHQYVHLLI